MDAIEIKELRQHLKLSQEKFAHLIGVSYGSVNRWERDLSKPSQLARKKLTDLKDEIEKSNG